MADLSKKPVRPEGFPLYAHRSGYWAKEICGKTYYFDTWDSPDSALKKYNYQKDYLKAGQIPPPVDGPKVLTVLEVLDRFLVARKKDIRDGELTQRTWLDYQRTCKLISGKFGGLAVERLMPVDYAKIRDHLAKGVGPGTLARRIREARVALRYWSEIDPTKQPVFGKSFSEPSSKVKRKAKTGAKFYTAEQIRAFMNATTNPQFKAMMLLGLNCAFGNNDCATLKWSDLDLASGWHSHGRPKTGIPRRAKLWPETLEAIKSVKTDRRGLVFKTRYGNAWIQEPTETSSRIDSIARECVKIGLEFYTLRRTFRTVADNLADDRAIRQIMGHGKRNNDMGDVYVQFVDDKRVAAVSEYVRQWFTGVSPDTPASSPGRV